jgi:hypothetical protein
MIIEIYIFIKILNYPLSILWQKKELHYSRQIIPLINEDIYIGGDNLG